MKNSALQYSNKKIDHREDKAEIYRESKSKNAEKREYIQIGAFKELINADNLRASLKGEVKNIILVEEKDNGVSQDILYKVLLGPIDNDYIRKEVMLKLSDKGIVGFSRII